MFINNHLMKFIKGAERKVLFVIFLSVIVTFISSAVSLLTAILVDVALRGGSLRMFSSFNQIFVCIAAGICISYFFFVTRARQAEKAGIIIKDNVRFALLRKLFQLGPAYTYTSRTGTLASTVTSRVEKLKYYYTNYMPAAVSAILNAVIFVALLFTADVIVGAVALIACFGMLVCPMLFFRAMKERGEREWTEHARYYSDCLDGIQGVSTLKALNANSGMVKRIAVRGEELRRAVMSHLKVTMTEGVVMEFFARLGSAFTVAVIVIRHIGGHIPAESTIFAYFFAAACFTPMLMLINSWHLGFGGVTASYSINELLDEKIVYSLSEISAVEDSTAASTADIDGDIHFDNITFAYTAKDGDVIHGIDLTIQKGTMTALVGQSGSGKSTMAHLLAGFYPANKGCISIGNTALSDKTVGVIQDHIAAVWQDSHLFYGTVYENILLGKPDATMEEVRAAAQAANLHDFVSSLPEGYETMIGERGMRFSGGERQRIAIARAYLRSAPILIFDEATSSLDPENEIDIQESFAKLSQGRTALVIAHRLSTIINADQICILEKGKIAALGKHDELLATSKLYRKLMGTQIIEEEFSV